MGMYNDYRGTGREGWKYTYKGSELVLTARKKYKELYDKEMASRKIVADLLVDPAISPNDRKLDEGKRDIEKYGTEREQCMVFCHEFARTPDREFTLGLGDITYFDLAADTPSLIFAVPVG